MNQHRDIFLKRIYRQIVFNGIMLVPWGILNIWALATIALPNLADHAPFYLYVAPPLLLITFVLAGVPGILFYSATRVCAGNLIVRLGEDTISTECSVAGDPGLNFFNRRFASETARKFNRELKFSEIAEVKFRNHMLCLLPSKSFFKNYGRTIYIPKEIDDFEGLRRSIEAMT